jgi:zinc transporter
MSRYFRYADGKAWEAERSGCVAHDPAREFLWIHIDGIRDNVDDILAEFTHIPHQAVAALKAHETRPRCTEFGEGALINLRGLGAPSAIDGDPLVSIRFWAERGLTITLAFRELGALERIMSRMLAGGDQGSGRSHLHHRDGNRRGARS